MELHFELEKGTLVNKMDKYCTLLGMIANPEEPSACESYLGVDGVKV